METLKRIAQQIEEPHNKGDCFRACMCMVLGLDPAEVPNFRDGINSQNEFYRRVDDFSRGAGYEPFRYVTRDFRKPYPSPMGGHPVIVSGKSPRHDDAHSVVFIPETGQIIDPHSSQDGLDGPCSAIPCGYRVDYFVKCRESE